MLTRPFLIFSAVLVGLVAFGAWQVYQVTSLEQSVADLKRSIAALDTQLATALHATNASTTAAVALPTPDETARREVVVAKSQDQELQELLQGLLL